MWHVWGREELETGVWSGNFRERDKWEVIGLEGKIILKWIFEKG